MKLIGDIFSYTSKVFGNLLTNVGYSPYCNKRVNECNILHVKGKTYTL